MKKVLVTGANGFIGRSIVPLLMKKGMEVHCIDIKSPEESMPGVCWHQINLMNYEKMLKLMLDIKPTHLLHFAWFAVPDEYWTSPENIRWVQASLELLRSFIHYGGKRVVMAGSCAEYDWNYGYCSEEFTPLKPVTLYGICKHSLQTILTTYTKQSGISSAWGRIFFLYGPYELPSRLISYVISSLLKNEQALCSQGNQFRDFLYVEDVASAFVSLLDSSVEGPVNICSGRPVSIQQIVMNISKKLNCENLIRFGAKSSLSEPPLIVGDNRRLVHEVNWIPSVELTAGIDKTIEWWKKRL